MRVSSTLSDLLSNAVKRETIVAQLLLSGSCWWEKFIAYYLVPDRQQGWWYNEPDLS
jgi:hypothetical protein